MQKLAVQSALTSRPAVVSGQFDPFFLWEIPSTFVDIVFVLALFLASPWSIFLMLSTPLIFYGLILQLCWSSAEF